LGQAAHGVLRTGTALGNDYAELFTVVQAAVAVGRHDGDYAKIAEGLGAVGITVTQPSEVAAALKQAMQLNKEGKTVLLDIHSNLEARRSNFS